MKRVRSTLLLALLAAVTLRVVWWAIQPIVEGLIPYLVVAIVLVAIGGALYYRTRRW